MALITCPECGKEISNKSKQCIHCGYPLEDNNYSTTLYSMVLSKLNNKANPFVIKLFLEEIYKKYDKIVNKVIFKKVFPFL